MQVEIFGAWIIIISAMVIYSVLKRNAATLLFSGLLILPFGYDLTFNGLDIVNGINTTTGAYTYVTVLPANDMLFGFLALGTFIASFAIMFFAVMVLYKQLFEMSKRPAYD